MACARQRRAKVRGQRLACAVPILAAALLVGCSSTGSGGTGDPASPPNPSKLGDGARLTELLGPATWFDAADKYSDTCASPLDYTTNVTGVTIVAIDRFDESGSGANGNFYVQDTNPNAPAFSGITVFAPSFSPPDLRLTEGDVADVSGVLQEFLGPSNSPFGYCKTLPEIGGTMTFRFEAGPLLPKTIALDDLKSYPTSRQWLGMLVRVEGVRIAHPPDESGGRFTADIDVGGGLSQTDVPKISNELYNLKSQGPALTQGSTFRAVTGVLTYFYGFKISPRSPNDFDP